MKIVYTGRQVELAPAQIQKVETSFAKIGKMLDGKEEREAHVVLSMERHLHNTEITINYHDHTLVGEGSDPDLFTSIHQAIAKTEKQAIKLKDKWRDTKRVPHKEESEAAAESSAPAQPAATDAKPEPKIYRVNHTQNRKPMTLEEALLVMKDGNDDYVAYQDPGTNCLSVLVRRRDGHFDLIEA
ncbi:MAG: ribosome-associated translation inhibitor RaiA [Acidobacteriota bacterium]|nr:ribosome-associated translation inhibitor RaiA [Acidobacteriota bacterium]